jgi:hypothetical protein
MTHYERAPVFQTLSSFCLWSKKSGRVALRVSTESTGIAESRALMTRASSIRHGSRDPQPRAILQLSSA